MKRFPQLTLLLGLLGLLICSQAFAQDAERILSKARDKVNNLDAVAVEFKKKVTFQGGNSTAFSGSFYLKGDDKFSLSIQGQHVISDGRKLYSINAEDQEITIRNIEKGDRLSPDRLFRLSQDDMKSRYEGQEAIAGHSCHRIALFPQGEADYINIVVWIDADEYLPRKMRTNYKNGSVVEYAINSIDTSPDIKASYFKFDKSNYPGFFVEDLTQ